MIWLVKFFLGHPVDTIFVGSKDAETGQIFVKIKKLKVFMKSFRIWFK